jgi:hypothetical protein
MHDIKYFFLNKNNQIIQKGGGEINYRKTLFFKIQRGQLALDPLGSAPACIKTKYSRPGLLVSTIAIYYMYIYDSDSVVL